MRVILWTIAAIVSSIANGKILLWQNDPYGILPIVLALVFTYLFFADF